VATATVETLTAEVRVLMVGNRQVTLSVYRQLDTVNLADMEPFGRVNDSKDDGRWLVGKCVETGALVRASFRPWFSFLPYIDESNLSGEITVCWDVHVDRYSVYRLRFGDRQIEVSQDVVARCEKEDHKLASLYSNSPQVYCGGWNPNGLEDQIRAAIVKTDEVKARHRAAAELPLIVLAGLR
jgi:hypothetical protein